MKYCTRCLYPANHPYGIIFDEHGVCSGCRVHEEKDTLDWDARLVKLQKIAEANRRQMKGRGFDCIIPIHGGGDSYFIVHTVKNVLGMNPLLVYYNSHYNTERGIRNMANLATVFDCDVITSTLSTERLQRVTRQSIKQYGSMYWQALAGYLTFPVQVAVKYRIPKIIWGVHPWSDQTGMYSHLDEVEMTERCRVEHGLMGIYGHELIDNQTVFPEDIMPFNYPEDSHLEAVGVRGIYLSNYIRWDAKAQHEQMIDTYGYESAAQSRTFNTYEDVHCHHSAGIHDYIKFLKLGYGKVTDHASREIRLKRMSRAEGIAMVQQYRDVSPPDMALFLDWIGMSEAAFMSHIWNRRDGAIWQDDGKDGWSLKDCVTKHADDAGVDAAALDKKEDCAFRITPSADPMMKEDHYLLMGRGYIDAYNYGARADQPEGGAPTPRTWREMNLKEAL